MQKWLYNYTERIFAIGNSPDPEKEFNSLALEAFEFQRKHNRIYRHYLGLTGKENFHPSDFEQIPFLPILLFKENRIWSGLEPEAPDTKNCLFFASSATTGMKRSVHLVPDPALYERSFSTGFRNVYGNQNSYNLLGLLPSYLERENSSLAYMAEHLVKVVKESGGTAGFYLYNHKELLDAIIKLSGGKSADTESGNTLHRKTIVLGVSFALLDFAQFAKEHIPEAEERRKAFCNVIVIETGGMKGRGQELTRTELHRRLSGAFPGSRIDSEYGMCELLSQAYSTGGQEEDGIFFCPPWMRVLARDLQDPFRILPADSALPVQGGLNIIDLANIHSCCFIETEDLGRLACRRNSNGLSGIKSVHPPFMVDGRIINSELRGCNMLIE